MEFSDILNLLYVIPLVLYSKHHVFYNKSIYTSTLIFSYSAWTNYFSLWKVALQHHLHKKDIIANLITSHIFQLIFYIIHISKLSETLITNTKNIVHCFGSRFEYKMDFKWPWSVLQPFQFFWKWWIRFLSHFSKLKCSPL